MSYQRNRVKQTASGSGTGSLTLGAAATGYCTAADAYSDAERFIALIEQNEHWEISLVYHSSSGTALTRLNCIASSNANAFVSFPAGDKTLAVVPFAANPAELAAAPTTAENMTKGHFTGQVVAAPANDPVDSGLRTPYVCSRADGTGAKWAPLPVPGSANPGTLRLGGDLATNAANRDYSTVLNGVRNQGPAYGLAVGKGAVGDFNASVSVGGGVVLNAGNFETGVSAVLISCGAATTNATPTKMAFDFDHATNFGLYVDSGVLRISAKVVAFEPATGDAKEWTVEAMARMTTDYLTLELIGTPTVTSAFASTGAALWSVAVSVDTLNETLDIEVTGEAARTIRWGATITACSLIHYV